MIACFDRSNPEEVERVRSLNAELLEVCLEHGFIPYKAPDWAMRRMARDADPGYLDLLARVKGLLDPEGIMNPGRLALGGPDSAR
jgi:FAD/FMN-containing dehydrogenase